MLSTFSKMVTVPSVPWDYYNDVTIDNTLGVSLTDYQHKLVLTASNFDFSLAKSDGGDIRLYNDDVLLDYWIEEYDSTNEYAVIWFSLSIGVTSKTIQLTYGNDTLSDISDADAVFEYFNALASQSDLDALSTVSGTGTWSIYTDATAPDGYCVKADVSAFRSIRYEAATLPSHYIVEMLGKQVDSDGAYLGPLLNCGGTTQFFLPGTDVDTASGCVRMAASGTYYSRSAVSGALIGLAEWYKIKGFFIPRTYFIDEGTFHLIARSLTQQGVTCNDTDSEIIVAYTDAISRYSYAGVEQEYYSEDPGGTSWGDLHVKDNLIYLVRTDGVTSTKIYSYADNDLASGATEVADISSSMDTGARGITFDGVNWIIGEFDSTSANLHLYIFNTSWVLQDSIVIPRMGDETYGIKCLEYTDGILYVCNSLGYIQAFDWNSVTYEAELTNLIYIGYTDPCGIAWQDSENRWIINNDKSVYYEYQELTDHATEKTFTATFGISGKSHAMPLYITTPYTTANIGVGCSKIGYMAQLFVRQYTDKVPEISISAVQET